jgi:Uma2 family endonuclease
MPLSSRQSDGRRFSYADYRTWPDSERWELIDGVAYAMSPAPSRLHQDVVLGIGAQAFVFLKDHRCRAYVAPFDVRLPEGDAADDRIETVVQPDIVVVCNPDKLDEAGCRGAPDWIVEVLSPSTALKDQTAKRDLYERHGVREYWLVHPTDRVLIGYRLEQGAYDKPSIQPLEGLAAVGAVAGLTIDWSFLA